MKPGHLRYSTAPQDKDKSHDIVQLAGSDVVIMPLNLNEKFIIH